jgi:membrane protease YdiL (CAAX protease family)
MEQQPSLVNQSPQRSVNIFLNERGLRPGWRLLIFIAIFLCLQSLAGVILVLFGVKRAQFAHPSPGLMLSSEFLSLCCVLIASWIMSRIEHCNMGEYGLPLRNSQALSRFARGYLFWGFVPLSALLLCLHGLHAFDFGTLALHGGQILYWAALWGLLFLFVGLFEEYLLRGYALHTLAEGIGFWPAAIVLAALFALGHATNTGETRIGLVMTGFFAIFASVLLWRTGNLWLAVGAHAGWDWAQTYFYGVSDSGLLTPGHLLNSRIEGAAWLNGGSVGPEGSALALPTLTLMFIAALVIYRKGQQPPRAVLYSMPLPPHDRLPE